MLTGLDSLSNCKLDACPLVAVEFLIDYSYNRTAMKLKVIVHEAEEGGYWAEVPSIQACATQGETFEELLQTSTTQSRVSIS